MTTEQAALCELMSMPPIDDLTRTHRRTVDGDPDRMTDIWPRLARAYVSHVLETRDERVLRTQ